ncbi:hypothetical protein EVJ58_g10247 [Rhodofomes roseus]|uniref:Uncharacterized protein n=1 Tax=Rhodofomes roseus TaxID=34475 RepID=A0A4Y9XRK0_9APHY|nr:hypothetical protein EVJ58_g10247 [Rhodofomes roseus]
MDVETYGRNRQSIADLEQELYNIFEDHPRAHINESGDPVVPADALVDVLRAFSRSHDSVELMTPTEEDQLTQLIDSNPGLAVTPQVLLQFIAMRTNHSPEEDSPPHEDYDYDFPERGRSEDRDYDDPYSRSSSRDSNGTSVWRPGSRPSSRPPSLPYYHRVAVADHLRVAACRRARIGPARHRPCPPSPAPSLSRLRPHVT